MAQNTTTALVAETWTQLSNADITAITVQNKSDYDIYIACTAGATPPTSTSVAVKLAPGERLENITLANYFLGVGSGNRIYAYAPDGGSVYFSHG